MKIGVIGSGEVGRTLASGFLKHNYDVMIGSEHQEKLIDWKEKSGYLGSIGSFAETAEFGQIIVLAVKGMVAKEVLTMINEKINGKIVIDTTNPISTSPPENGVLRFFTSLDRSLMEELQSHIPGAKFVKAFNSIGSAFIVNPDFGT